MIQVHLSGHREPWNKGKLVGQKAPLKLKDIWAIRVRLQLGKRTRELALFDLGIDSKLRACVSIPVNVTADSGNVTGILANVTEGRCCAF